MPDAVCASSPEQLIGLEDPAPFEAGKKLVCPITPSLDMMQPQEEHFRSKARGDTTHREQEPR
jgi:hypothetical protein